MSSSHLSPPSNANRSQVTYRVRGIPLEYRLKKVQELLQSALELGTRRDAQIRSLAIGPDQQTKMATVDFKAPPASLASDRNEWSFEILDDEGSDSKDDENDDDDIVPKAPTITIDNHFNGITILRSFKNVLEHKIE
jgi:hypothetical protein